MTTLTVALSFVRDRRRSLLAWTLGIIALVLIMAVFYPSIRDTGADFDAYVESLPESVRESLGISGASIASPEGYLMSQMYSNIYPLVILILGISMGSWAIAGAEGEGTLEMTLAAPLRRVSLAWGRFVAMAAATLAITAISTAALAVIAAPLGLLDGLPWWGIWSAAFSMWALVMLYASAAFAIGAATGRRAWAIAGAAALIVIGFLGQMFASLAQPLEYLRTTSPWYWFLGSSPLTEPPGLVSFVLPAALALIITMAGVWRFDRRDLGA